MGYKNLEECDSYTLISSDPKNKLYGKNGKFIYFYRGMDWNENIHLLNEFGECLNEFNEAKKTFWSRLKWLIFG